MLLADQRSDAGERVFRAAMPQAFSPRLQPCHERLEDRPLDIDPLGAEADLAAIGERRPHRAFDRLVEIGVGKHQRGVLAAEFERHRTDPVRGLAHDRLAGAGFAGEGDAVDAGMPGQELAGRVGPSPCTTL